MSVKEHYDNHLGRFYSWMSGNFHEKVKDNKQFFESNNIIPNWSGVAIDLGAAHGIQSVALANLGFNVKSVDFNRTLLDELKINSKGLNVEIFEDDIRNVLRFAGYEPELIVCMGDTLTHLESKADIGSFIKDISETLAGNGQLVLSFRDYSNELTNNNRFIQVKSDCDRILTCFLEYQTGQ